MPVQHTADHWKGSLAMTVACATVAPEPQAILKTALKEFLAEHPPGNELGDLLRTAMKEKP